MQKLFYSLIFILTSTFLFAEGKEALSSKNDPNTHETSPKNELSLSGGYVKTGDFDGGLVSSRVGRAFMECAHARLSIELEANVLFMEAKDNRFYPCLTQVQTPQGSEIVRNITANRKVYLHEYPLFINGRYTHKLGGALSMLPIFVGLGVGLNIVHAANTLTGYKTEYIPSEKIALQAVESSLYSRSSSTRGYLAGQIFGGLSCQITPQLSFNLQGRILGTGKRSYGGGVLENTEPILERPEVSTGHFYYLVEGGLDLAF